MRDGSSLLHSSETVNETRFYEHYKDSRQSDTDDMWLHIDTSSVYGKTLSFSAE